MGFEDFPPWAFLARLLLKDSSANSTQLTLGHFSLNPAQRLFKKRKWKNFFLRFNNSFSI